MKITAHNLSVCTHDGKPLLHNMDLCIPEGKTTAIIGRNGAGKSTLLRALSGLSSYRGDVSYGSTSLASMDFLEQARHRAVLPQQVPSQVHFRVCELLSMGVYAAQRQLSKQDAEALIQRTGKDFQLINLYDRIFSNLSGGEQQRVLLARAVIQLRASTLSEGILFLDEPLNHLDLVQQADLFQRLHLLKQQGLTVVAVLHDINHVARIADHVICLHHGEVIARGTPGEVLVDNLFHEAFEGVVPYQMNETNRSLSHHQEVRSIQKISL